ncbi:hypothetical protein [Streptomyces arboris]|uniref:hypothetical protein n=1 Tax=Streptomyces arboris TaxID=2600619 RepID=UPI003642FCA1
MTAQAATAATATRLSGPRDSRRAVVAKLTATATSVTPSAASHTARTRRGTRPRTVSEPSSAAPSAATRTNASSSPLNRAWATGEGSVWSISAVPGPGRANSSPKKPR